MTKARVAGFLVILAVVGVGCTGVAAPTVAPTNTPTPTPTGQATPTPARVATPVAQPTPAGPVATPSPTGGAVVLPPGGLVLDVSRVAIGGTPADWIEVRSADGACRVAAPADWTTDVLPGMATSPGFEAQALLGHDQYSGFGGNWTAYKELSRDTFINDEVVLHSNDEVFVMRSPETVTDVTYLALLRRADSACTVLASVKGNWVDDFHPTLVQILESLAEVQ